MVLSEKVTKEKKLEGKTTLPTPPITPLVKIKTSASKLESVQTNLSARANMVNPEKTVLPAKKASTTTNKKQDDEDMIIDTNFVTVRQTVRQHT